MVIIYGIIEDWVHDYGYVDVETDPGVFDYMLDRDRCEWIVPGTMED